MDEAFARARPGLVLQGFDLVNQVGAFGLVEFQLLA